MLVPPTYCRVAALVTRDALELAANVGVSSRAVPETSVPVGKMVRSWVVEPS